MQCLVLLLVFLNVLKEQPHHTSFSIVDVSMATTFFGFTFLSTIINLALPQSDMGGMLGNGAYLHFQGNIHPNVEDESIKQALRTVITQSTLLPQHIFINICEWLCFLQLSV